MNFPKKLVTGGLPILFVGGKWKAAILTIIPPTLLEENGMSLGNTEMRGGKIHSRKSVLTDLPECEPKIYSLHNEMSYPYQ